MIGDEAFHAPATRTAQHCTPPQERNNQASICGHQGVTVTPCWFGGKTRSQQHTANVLPLQKGCHTSGLKLLSVARPTLFGRWGYHHSSAH
jgi:hypothetical protein